MEIHVVEAQIVAQGMNMHLAHALGVVAGPCELSCQGVLVPPGDTVLVAHAAVVALLHAGVEGGAGGDAAGAGAVGPVKGNAPGGQRVQVGCLYIRVARIAQSIAPELVCHK